MKGRHHIKPAVLMTPAGLSQKTLHSFDYDPLTCLINSFISLGISGHACPDTRLPSVWFDSSM